MEKILSKTEYKEQDTIFKAANMTYSEYLEFIQLQEDFQNVDEFVVWQTGMATDEEGEDGEEKESSGPCGACTSLEGQIFHISSVPPPPHDHCKCGTIPLRFHIIYEQMSERLKKLEDGLKKTDKKKSYISSEYGKERKLGIYGGKTKPHKGTDFKVPEGTPIPAVKGGIVTKSGWQDSGNHGKGYGVRVEVKHSDGTYGTYGHLQDGTNIALGSEISKGEIVGNSGNTGGSTGPHFHYNDWDSSHTETPPSQETLDYFNDYFNDYFG